MKEALNEFRITGFLKSKDLKAQKTKSGRDAIMGSLTVEVNEGGRVHNHRVELFSFKETKDGKPNGIYASYETIMNEYKDRDHFCDEADYISVNGSLDYNVYKGADGKAHEGTRFRGRFANRVSNYENHLQESTANVSMIVDDYEEEIRDDKPTGMVKIKAYTAGYNGRGIKLIGLKTKTANNVHTQVPAGTTLETTLQLNNYVVVKREEKANSDALFGTMKSVVESNSYVRNNEMISARMPEEQYTPEDLQALKKSVREQISEAEARQATSSKPKATTPAQNEAINNALPF